MAEGLRPLHGGISVSVRPKGDDQGGFSFRFLDHARPAVVEHTSAPESQTRKPCASPPPLPTTVSMRAA